MRRYRNLLFNSCFAINCLLVFSLLFESRLVLPAWLQVAGRLHMMLLHFPIALLILSVAWSLFAGKVARENETVSKMGDGLILLTALTASLTALLGLFLSKEEGYDAGALQWHKWGGVAISLITTLWYAYRERIKKSNGIRVSVAVISLALIIFTGHQGAGITHGPGYLLAPVRPATKQPTILLDDAAVYLHMVKPVLQSKCMGCHNSKKAKGQLVMETEELLVKGGKNGKLWDHTAEGYGLLLSRVHLPADAKKHMPPAGKPQLTEQEIQILYHWIKSGADFNVKVTDLPETDTLRIIANSIFNTIETDDYDFAAAGEKTIKELNTNYRVVYPLAKGSPALGAEFFGAAFYQPAQINDLLAVNEQVVSLSLNRMPVSDEELKTIGRFTNLRKLNLSFTAITGKTLGALTALKELRQLSLSGTAVKKEDVIRLSPLKNLSHLYVWNTNITDADIAELKSNMKGVVFEKGFKGDTTLLQLTPPVLLNEEQVITEPVSLQLKHYVNGVSIRYTLDGSDPDSLRSPEYTSHILLTKNGTVKAKAFKAGWISSDVLETYFYHSTYRIDSVINLMPPEEAYKGDGPRTLADLQKGEAGNFKSGKWLGYRKNKLESLLWFAAPATISSITLSTLVDIGGYIMPPVSVEAWGGNEPGTLKLLGRITPQQPGKVQPAYLKAFEIAFAPVTVKYLKIVALPVAKLPAWHPGKGDRGWVFADEVFVN